MNGWISVNDRLPGQNEKQDHSKDVLCYVPERDGCSQHGVHIGCLHTIHADDGSGNFWGIKTKESEWCLWGWSYFEHPVVTHWMPLPEPPEEECV